MKWIFIENTAFSSTEVMNLPTGILVRTKCYWAPNTVALNMIFIPDLCVDDDGKIHEAPAQVARRPI